MGSPIPWTYIQRIVDVLPLAAVIKGQYFCVHGGIGPELQQCGITGLQKVKRPAKEPHHILLTRVGEFFVCLPLSVLFRNVNGLVIAAIQALAHVRRTATDPRYFEKLM